MNRPAKSLRVRLGNTLGMFLSTALLLLGAWAGGSAGLWVWHELGRIATQNR